MLFCRQIFSKSTFHKILSGIPSGVKQFGSRSDPTLCRPDLEPNCLLRLSEEDTSRQRVKKIDFFEVY